MKKLALLASIVATAAVVGVGVASATGEPNIVASSEGFACNVFNREGGLFTTFNSSSILLENGKEILHCIGAGAGKGDTIVTQSGFACGMVFTGLSTDPNNSSKVSRLGQSQLWCYGQAGGDAAASGPAGAIG
jgi:hypothetical protein